MTAGSRFKYLAPKIPFGYKYLEQAVAEAIDKEAEISGAKVVDHAEILHENILSYDELRTEAMDLWKTLVEANEENAARVLRKAEIIFGRSIRLSEIVEGQEQPFLLLIEEMRDMVKTI